ncbi:MAG: radical SAM protein [Pseudomonadota bacterium]
MDDGAFDIVEPISALSPEKFKDPDITAKGEVRARVGLDKLDTLWFNTGTLCNIQCLNCYIESSPSNDRLVYITTDEVRVYLDEIEKLGLATREIAFTGGEPFMNPDMIEILSETLSRGFEALVLTNAMQPMQRPKIKAGLLNLKERFGDKLTLRISLDHHSADRHDLERGSGSFDKALVGVDWLAEHGFALAVAGRTIWGETEAVARAGYDDLFATRGWPIDASNAGQTVLFPEMENVKDIPEITTACWDILSLSPSAMMCASSRMVVKRKGETAPKVLPCTLLPYDAEFEMGETLTEAAFADGGNFEHGAVKLNHPYCAKFCVLGGGSCSA